MREADTLWDTLNDQVATKFLGLKNHRSILDVGCGGGMWTWTLRRLTRSRSIRMVGLDLDRQALGQASKCLGGEAELVAADASFLPFKDGSFDLTTCRRLLINLRPRKRRDVIREMSRVARAGGTVSSVEPSLQTNRANHFSTIKGNLRFSKRLEKAVSGTDFTLGPRVPYLFLREGLEDVKVWAYLWVNSHLPPRYERLFLSTVVHEGGFVHALSTVTPRLGGERGRGLRREAERLDREVRRQRRRGSLVSVSAIPVFVTSGTKPSP